MNSTVSFIIVLGVLIFVHEFGHFLTAKFFGIKVLKFSLGFGPKIIAKQFGETEYLISALPLGGYVKMLGEQPTDDVSTDMAGRSFAAKAVWKRFLVVLAGPLSNLISAIIIFTVVILITGIPSALPTTEIGQISPSSPAEQAGLKPGDRIISIDAKPMSSWQEISESVKNSAGKKLTLSIKRNEEIIESIATPNQSEIKNIFGEVVDTRYLLGITQKELLHYEPATLTSAFVEGLDQTRFYIELTIMSLWKIIQRVIPASQLGGPIMIAQMAGQQMEAGWLSLFSFMAVLSVNLGIINLFPIPILDGGHLFFFSIEALRRKPLPLHTQERLQQIGMVLLGSLMLFVFYNDFARLLGKG